MKQDDPELIHALRSFAEWFFAADTPAHVIDEQIGYATDLYTRPDHTGTCIPKTILFAYYKGLQFDPDFGPQVSENARAALKARPVPSWPDGVVRKGATWSELFRDYSAGYE